MLDLISRVSFLDFGNYQNHEEVERAMQERRSYGHFFYRFPNGESGADVCDRVSTFLETLHRDFQKESALQNVIIVTHGLTLRLFLMRWFHWTVEEFESLSNPNNGEFFIMEKDDNNKYRLTTPLKRWTPPLNESEEEEPQRCQQQQEDSSTRDQTTNTTTTLIV